MATRIHIQISDHEYQLLKNITDKYHKDFSFYVFGSRVKNKAKKYSDIDIAYKALGNSSIALLPEELENSNIGIRIDLVNLDTIDDEFSSLIKSEMIPLK